MYTPVDELLDTELRKKINALSVALQQGQRLPNREYYTEASLGSAINQLISLLNSYQFSTNRIDALLDTGTDLVSSASPAFTGTPTAPTATAGTNTTQIATTAYIMNALTNYLSASTAASTFLSLSSAISTYAPKASPTFSGTVTLSTVPSSGTATSILGLNASGNVITTTSANGQPTITATTASQNYYLTFAPNSTTTTASDVYVNSSLRYNPGLDTISVTNLTASGTNTINGYATLSSPALTGTPTAPTATEGTNTTQLATTAYIMNALANYLTSTSAATTYLTLSSATSNYLTISAAGNYLTTANASSTYAPLASPALTGTPTAPTATAGTNTTQLATTAYMMNALANYLTSTLASSTYLTTSSAASTYLTLSNAVSYAPKASPTFTGTVSLPSVTFSTVPTSGTATSLLGVDATGNMITSSLAIPTQINVSNTNTNTGGCYPAFFTSQTAGNQSIYVEPYTTGYALTYYPFSQQLETVNMKVVSDLTLTGLSTGTVAYGLALNSSNQVIKTTSSSQPTITANTGSGSGASTVYLVGAPSSATTSSSTLYTDSTGALKYNQNTKTLFTTNVNTSQIVSTSTISMGVSITISIQHIQHESPTQLGVLLLTSQTPLAAGQQVSITGSPYNLLNTTFTVAASPPPGSNYFYTTTSPNPVDQIYASGGIVSLLSNVVTLSSAGLALTGVPTAPTADSGTNTTQIATTAFVTAAVGGGGGVSKTGTQTGINTTLQLLDSSSTFTVQGVTGSLMVKNTEIGHRLGSMFDFTVAGGWTDSNSLYVTTGGMGGNNSGVGIGYNSVLDTGLLCSIAPNVSWKQMTYKANAHAFNVAGNTLALDINGSGMTLTRQYLQLNNATAPHIMIGAGSSNYIGHATAAGNFISDSGVGDLCINSRTGNVRIAGGAQYANTGMLISNAGANFNVGGVAVAGYNNIGFYANNAGYITNSIGMSNAGISVPANDLYIYANSGGVIRFYNGSTSKVAIGSDILYVDSMTAYSGGKITINQGLNIIAPDANALRLCYPNTTSGYGVVHHNNGYGYYLLLTNNGDPLGGFNGYRPLTVIMPTGLLQSENGQAFYGGLQCDSFTAGLGNGNHVALNGGNYFVMYGSSNQPTNCYLPQGYNLYKVYISTTGNQFGTNDQWWAEAIVRYNNTSYQCSVTTTSSNNVQVSGDANGHIYCYCPGGGGAFNAWITWQRLI